MSSKEIVRDHRTYVEVDASALRGNLRVLKEAVGPARKVILVVKSDAYGHGAGTVAAVATKEGIDHFAVVSVDEGIQLRRAGVSGNILLLHPPLDTEIPSVLRWRLTVGVSSEATARRYSDYAGDRILPVHIEINTGLSRLGINWDRAGQIVSRIASLPYLKIEGIYTHYRAHFSAEGDSIREQSERFNRLLDELNRLRINPGLRHAASSYPASFHADTFYDAIRVGLMTYGTMEKLPPPFEGLRPVMSVRSQVLHTRRIQAGEWVHYGDSYRAPQAMDIGVIPIGYGMGYPRHLSNKAHVLIAGKRCPVAGVIGMDLMMVDISALDSAQAGDPVTILGRDADDEITAVELANRADTIAYEITCRLGNALPRYVTGDGQKESAPSYSSHHSAVS